MNEANGPFLIIVWPPSGDRQQRLDFARRLMEKLRPACKFAPLAVVQSLDCITLLVEGHIGAISDALHHSRDNETRYLVVRPSLPVASYGVATSDQWIRNHCG